MEDALLQMWSADAPEDGWIDVWRLHFGAPISFAEFSDPGADGGGGGSCGVAIDIAFVSYSEPGCRGLPAHITSDELRGAEHDDGWM